MAVEKILQFLVCPQVDFIGRLKNGGLPSNNLHVGAFATDRLRGSGVRGAFDPYVETVSAIVDAAQPLSESTHLILDEDWHPRSCEEFSVFGQHCVKGTAGAKLVGELERLRWSARTHVIRANSINIASSPMYQAVLNEVVAGTRLENIRVGVFGVWTHIKVEYLLLNLSTLNPAFPHIGVCAPLCASPNAEDHTHALNKFRAMGHRVFDTIPEYLNWLGIKLDQDQVDQFKRSRKLVRS